MNDDETMAGLFPAVPTEAPEPDPAPSLDMLKRMFREAASATDQQRRNAREDRDFYDGPKQIDDAARAKMRKMRIPETYSNQIGSAIGATLGLLDSNDTAPEAVARNEDGEEAATIVTQVLRYSADKARLPVVLDATSESDLVEGICAAKIEVDGNDDAKVTALPYDEFYYDPRSMAYDFKDARYLIHAYWSDLDAIKRKWPHVQDSISLSGFDGDGPEDKPECRAYWVDGERRRVMLVDNFYIDHQTGTWKRAIYCHSVILEHGDTGYLDDQGQHICPIEALSYHVMRDGERRGMVRNLVPIQRKINGFEAALHRMAISNRVRVSNTAGTANPAERDLARREAQRTDGALPEGYDLAGTDPRYLEMTQAVATMKQEIADASPGRAQVAQAGANTSGRARQILQQAGLAELSRAFGKFQDFEERIYRQMWFRARQFMSEQKMIRVTDKAGARQTLALNVPIVETRHQPVMIPAVDPQTGQPIPGPDGQPAMRPAIDPMTGHPVMHAVTLQTGVKNELAQMDMDVTLKVVETADTLRDEGKAKLMEWSAKTGISPLDSNFKFMIKFFGIPDEAEILASYEECMAEAQQAAAPQQAAQQQAAQAQQQAQQTAMGARAQKDIAAAKRDETLAQKHQMEVQSAGLDLAYKQALLQHGLDPNSPHSPAL